ncbi:ABC transporter ATP-binding protein [Myxococcota bacterium]|nr:ABC transporter ATP-binding protein [Myxococcota bacterium]
MIPAIEVRGLAKIFEGRRHVRELVTFWRKPKPTVALDGVDLSVGHGELVAVLGPNGAGKTTMLKILATLILPSRGEVRVEGVDVVGAPERVRQRLGYVLADERSFFWRLSCRENLRFFASLQGIFGRDAEARIQELAMLVGLTEHLDRDFMDLSTGQKQRMAIARGLVADPTVVIFDEATRSLDPGHAAHVRRVIREILVERAKKAVLFATHDLHEARELADRVVLMAKGRVAAEGRYEDVEARVHELFREEARAEEAELFRLFPDLAERT